MKNRDFIIDKPNNLLESVIIIALMTSLRDRGHSSGSDLCEANLRGANLKDTLLELMPTPLHMSQTVR